MEKSERVPLLEAAKELNTTHLRVLMLIKQNVLAGTQVDGDWFVDRSSLDHFAEHGAELEIQQGCRTSCGAKSCGCGGK